MRAPGHGLAACALVLVLALGPAAAHTDHPKLASGQFLGHIELVEVALAPGQSQNWTLAYAGAPLPMGWNLLVRADVEGHVRGWLDIEGNWLARWDWHPGQQAEDFVLGATGFATLRIENVGPDNATVAFYYDHTCECSAKVAPLSPGLLWLNVEAAKGDTVAMDLFIQPVQTVIDNTTLPRNIDVTARYLEADAFGGFVPHASQSAAFSTDDPHCEPPVGDGLRRWNGCMQLRFAAAYDGRQLVRVTTQDDAATWHVLVVPHIEVEAGKESPLPLAVLPVALAAFWRRRLHD